MLRDNLIEVLDSDYVRMAELKGVPRWRVVLRHALPNALVPTLNVTALNLAYLIGGVVVVERVFSYPGFGSLLVDPAAARSAGDRSDGDDRRRRLCRGEPRGRYRVRSSSIRVCGRAMSDAPPTLSRSPTGGRAYALLGSRRR